MVMRFFFSFIPCRNSARYDVQCCRNSRFNVSSVQKFWTSWRPLWCLMMQKFCNVFLCSLLQKFCMIWRPMMQKICKVWRPMLQKFWKVWPIMLQKFCTPWRPLSAAEILQAKTSRVEEILCVARFSEILNRCFSILRKDIVEGPRIPTVSTSFLFRLFPFFSDHSRNNGRESRD